MITQKTVLILGAGASKSYGFPLGYELRDDVLSIADNHEGTEQLVFKRHTNFSSKIINDFLEDLRTSGYSSVDAYLENRQQWIEIGKYAMAFKLLQYENSAKLFPPKQPKDHWYEILWQKMKTESWQDFGENITVLTFNYDRSLEKYLSSVIINNYKVKQKDVNTKLSIIHLHGDLGSFENYGVISEENLKNAAKSIKIIHESSRQSQEFKNANKTLNDAYRILFIGFGYNETNLNKFEFFRNPIKHISIDGSKNIVLGTHKGFKSNAWDKIRSKYNFNYKSKSLGNGTISEFIQETIIN